MQDKLQYIPCAYFLSSGEGIIMEANEYMCNLLGYTKDELVGRNLESVFSLATRIFHHTHLYPLLKLKGQAEEIYINIKTKEGQEVPLLINAALKQTDGQTHLHFAGINIDKRKKFEEEIIAAKKIAEIALKENTALKAAQEELQHRAIELDKQIVIANLQNQELRQFNHVATHALQEPLRKLLYFSSQILGTEDLTGSKAPTQKIRKAAEDLNAKLSGLQQYVWLANEESVWEEVDLRNVIESARKQLELENPEITIMLKSESIPVIEANGKQMQFLLKEILSNALRFRKPGNITTMKIHASTLLLNEFRHLTEKYKYGEFVKLEIQDYGIGFDDKYQHQAFEMYGKLHSISGPGIGLSLCKKIVENHSGSISLESQKDIGTTAIIFLPIKQKNYI